MKFVSEHLNQKIANHDRHAIEIKIDYPSNIDASDIGQFIFEDYKISSFAKGGDTLLCLVNSAEEAVLKRYMMNNYSDSNPQFKKLSDQVVYSDLDFDNYRNFKKACLSAKFPIFAPLADRVSTGNVGCFKKDLKLFFEFMSKNYMGGDNFEEEFGSFYSSANKISFDEATRKKIDEIDKKLDIYRTQQSHTKKRIDGLLELKADDTKEWTDSDNTNLVMQRGFYTEKSNSIKKLEDQKARIKDQWHRKNDK